MGALWSWLLPERSPHKVLLLTHNVSGLFAGDDAVLAKWASEVADLARQSESDFVAVHLQVQAGSWAHRAHARSQAHALLRIAVRRSVPILAPLLSPRAAPRIRWRRSWAARSGKPRG